MSLQPDASFRLYGAPGWGSVLVEAALAQAGAPYEFEDVSGFDEEGPARARLLAINPLAQTPTLVLPDGEVMTESAAIILLLSELYPRADLAPPPGGAERPAFLRRLVWLAAAVYPTFTFADYPHRFAPSAPEELKEAVLARRRRLWLEWEAELQPVPWALGARFSALDIYVAAMTRWRPRRAWFEQHCPKLFGIAKAADALPRLRPVWTRNFGPA